MNNKKETVINRRFFPLVAIIILMVSMACRFNVREIGFAQISPNPYIFYYFYDLQTTSAEVDRFIDRSKKIFQYSNVKIKAVSSSDVDDPSLNYLSESVDRKFPIGVLLSPDGRVVEMQIPKGNKEEGVFLRELIASL